MSKVMSKKMNLLIKLSLFAIIIKLGLLSVSVYATDFQKILKQQDITKTSEYIDALSAADKKKVLEKRFLNGDTPLLFAARQGNLALFDVLIKAGANPSVQDLKARDVLNIAVQKGNVALAKKAINAGADVTAVTSVYQGSALIYATHQGQVEIAQMLIDAGAPLDRVNNLGWTALLEATILGNGGKKHQQIVKALLKAGANKDIADKQDLTPLDHAKQGGQTEIVKLLSKSAF